MDIRRAGFVYFGALHYLADTGKEPGGGLGVHEYANLTAGRIRKLGNRGGGKRTDYTLGKCHRQGKELRHYSGRSGNFKESRDFDERHR